MNYEQIVKFSFSWLKKTESLKYVLLYYLVNIVFFAGIFLIGLLFFQNLILSALSGSSTALTNFISNPASGVAIIGFLSVAFLWLLIFLIASLYVSLLMTLFALRSKSLPASQLGFVKVLKVIFLEIISSFIALLCIYNLKFLLVLVATIALFGLAVLFGVIGQGIIAVVCSIFAILALIAYLVITWYNSIRLSFSSVIFVSKDTGVFSALRESWGLTRGRVIDIIIASIIGAVVIMIVFMVIGFVFSIFTSVLALVLVSPALQIILRLILDTLVFPLQLLCSAFLSVAIYSELLIGKK